MSDEAGKSEPAARAFERPVLAAAVFTVTCILLAQGAVLVGWHMAGRSDLPPAEWVSAVAVVVGFPLAWATGLARRIARNLPDALDGAARRHRVAAIVCASFTVLALVQTARASAFMVDPTLKRDSSTAHLCMQAYVRAGELARASAPNIYEDSQYHAVPEGAPKPTSTVAHLQEYLGDVYEYPPPFVVLPRFALAFTNDFLVLRTAWFVLQHVLLAAIALALVRWVGGREALVAGVLVPALWASQPFLHDVEVGQFHLLSVALAMAGMVAFERRRDALGGGLLGAAVVVKLAPGLLLVYLLTRGRVRPVVATVAFVAAYAVAGVVVLGPAPYVAFFHYQLPRIASGAAFPMALSPARAFGNFGVYSLPVKLREFGVGGMTAAVSSSVAWVYGLLLLPVAVLSARRRAGTRIDDALRWLALLNLAALRSPFAPFFYVTSGTVWLLTLLAGTERGTRRLGGLAAAWVFFAVILGVTVAGKGDTALLAVPDGLQHVELTLGQLAVLGLNLWASLRRPSVSDPASAVLRDAVAVAPIERAEAPGLVA